MLKLLTLNAVITGMVFGANEPQVYWFGDLDPKTRALQGQLTIQAPTDADGLTGYRLYATADGSTTLPLDFADGSSQGGNAWQYEHTLDKVRRGMFGFCQFWAGGLEGIGF